MFAGSDTIHDGGAYEQEEIALYDHVRSTRFRDFVPCVIGPRSDANAELDDKLPDQIQRAFTGGSYVRRLRAGRS